MYTRKIASWRTVDFCCKLTLLKKRRSHAEPSLALHSDSTASPLQLHLRPISTSSIFVPIHYLVVIAVLQKLQIVYVVHPRARELFNFSGKEALVIFVSKSVTVSHNLLISKNIVLFSGSKLIFDESHTENDTKVYSEVVINYLAKKRKRDISRVVHSFIESRNLDKKYRYTCYDF